MAEDIKKDLEIFEINTLKTFIKIKGNSLSIGKIIFSFVEFDPATKKLIRNIDVYIGVADARLLCIDILSGRLAALAKAGNDGKPLFQTLGGLNEEKARAKGRTDGNALSRSMQIQPGTKFPFIFTAEIRPGHTNEKGLIVPDYKLPGEGKVSVACDNQTIKKMAATLQSFLDAYNVYLVNDYFKNIGR